MIRRMALAFIGVLWASTAQAQVPCSQCEPQAAQCQQQAYAALQACDAPYYSNYQSCLSNAYAVRASCMEICQGSGGVYCWHCEIQADWMVQTCNTQYSQDYQYCQIAYGATMQGCQDQFDDCQANCSNSAAYLSPVFGDAASRWNAPLAASAACVDASVSERAPAIAKPSAEL